METDYKPDSRNALRDLFLKKKEQNPAYSTYAFAKDLDVSQAYVSLLLNGKRKLSLKQAVAFSARLSLDYNERQRLLQAVTIGAVDDAQARQCLEQAISAADAANDSAEPSLDLDRYKVIAQWYHLAILELTTLEGFQPDIKWIAGALGIGEIEVRDAVDRLERLGILEIHGSRWIKIRVRLAVTTAYADEALRPLHRQMLERALRVVGSGRQDELGGITSTTIAIDPAKLAEANKMVQDFRRELIRFLSDGKRTTLYQFSQQLIPLTKDA